MSAVPFAVCVVEHFHCCYYCLHIARYVRWLASAVYNVYVAYILLLYSLCNNGNKRIVTSHMAGPRDSHEFQLISSIGSEWCGFECFIVLTLLCWMFFFFRDYVKIHYDLGLLIRANVCATFENIEGKWLKRM